MTEYYVECFIFSISFFDNSEKSLFVKKSDKLTWLIWFVSSKEYYILPLKCNRSRKCLALGRLSPNSVKLSLIIFLCRNFIRISKYFSLAKINLFQKCSWNPTRHTLFDSASFTLFQMHHSFLKTF